MRTERTGELELLGKFDMRDHMAKLQNLYFGRDLEAAIPLTGQVCGRIDEIKTAKQVIDETVAEFQQVMQGLAKQYA